jgi:hypothetical protein
VLNTQTGKVLKLMLDMKWHEAWEILEVAGGTEGLRRMRTLRTLPRVEIHKRKSFGSRGFAYRLEVT